MKIFTAIAKKLLKLKKPGSSDDIRKKQMMMHPGKSGQELMEEYFIEKTAKILLIGFAGVTLSIIIWVSTSGDSRYIKGNVIERNSYGQGEKLVTMDIYADDAVIQKGAEVTVAERQYTEAEISKIFDDMGAKLKKAIMKENITADHIDRDLDLVTSLEEYPVNIEWQVSDYSIIDGKGRIQEDYRDSRGQLVKLSAALTYGDFNGSYDYFVKVYPRKLEEKDGFVNAVKAKINDYGAATVSYNSQLLPGDIEGKKLSYRVSAPQTALYVLFLAAAAAAGIYFGQDRELDKAVKKRERDMLLSYPEIVNKLTLLLGAGMTVRAAFEKVAADHFKNGRTDHALVYDEMLITVNRMKSGMSEFDAYVDFGKRCSVKRYTKLGALLSQNLKKGSQGLLQILEEESKDAFEDRKANARKLGEEAGTKLLAPMGMMLMVVMIVVIVPAFLSFTI